MCKILQKRLGRKGNRYFPKYPNFECCKVPKMFLNQTLTPKIARSRAKKARRAKEAPIVAKLKTKR